MLLQGFAVMKKDLGLVLLDWTFLNVIEKAKDSYAPAAAGNVSHKMRSLCRM